MTERVDDDHMETEPTDPGAKTQPAEGGVDEADDEDATPDDASPGA